MRTVKLKIIIADGAEIFGIGLKSILEQQDDIRVIDVAKDGEEALRKTLRAKPDLLVLGDTVARFNSYEVLHRLYLAMSTTRVLLLTDADPKDAYRLGAYRCLTRQVGADELIRAVYGVTAGERFVAADEAARTVEASGEPLSVRELEVLKCITEGKSNQQIAQTLYISEKTVKNHLTRIFRKMNVTDRTQAAVQAIRERQIVLD